VWLFKNPDGPSVDKAPKFGFGALPNLRLRQGSKGISEIFQQFCQCLPNLVALVMHLALLCLCPASLVPPAQAFDERGMRCGAEPQLLELRWPCQK